MFYRDLQALKMVHIVLKIFAEIDNSIMLFSIEVINNADFSVLEYLNLKNKNHNDRQQEIHKTF